uniref:Uncharacterized protein n=1 Tax=Salix viminalis TaxID=40686 RepID=A0A6N2MWG9_SALVM
MCRLYWPIRFPHAVNEGDQGDKTVELYASSGDQISTESKYHAVLTSLAVLEFMLIGKMATYFCDHQNHAKKQIQGFASQAIASHFTSTIRSALGAV